jgi:hypothetical protein
MEVTTQSNITLVWRNGTPDRSFRGSRPLLVPLNSSCTRIQHAFELMAQLNTEVTGSVKVRLTTILSRNTQLWRGDPSDSWLVTVFPAVPTAASAISSFIFIGSNKRIYEITCNVNMTWHCFQQPGCCEVNRAKSNQRQSDPPERTSGAATPIFVFLISKRLVRCSCIWACVPW